jgi:murein DD-endopeptidase MepM/ murein hydrolase activator NlpD
MLVVRGDGVRILWLNFPRRLPLLVIGVVMMVVLGVGALAGDWWQIRQRMLEAQPLLQQLDEQRATLDSFNRRAAELRREVASWRDMHARIWEPFGPEMATRVRKAGIGGARGILEDRAASRLTPTDELEQLAETVMQEGESLRALDRLIARARKALNALPMRWPVRGAVNSEYGNRLSPWTLTREFHAGIDIAADRGTPVRAPAAGTVVSAGNYGEYGIAVILDHGEDIRTVYGHLSKLSVASGQKVERGTRLGFTGNTGRSSGPHLHYEILVKGHPVNPRAYLWN